MCGKRGRGDNSNGSSKAPGTAGKSGCCGRERMIALGYKVYIQYRYCLYFFSLTAHKLTAMVAAAAAAVVVVVVAALMLKGTQGAKEDGQK